MRGVESDFPQPRGMKKKQMSKYLVGGGALLLIIGLIWFPLLLFALGSTVGVSNLPSDVSMKIRIGPYEPIYMMSAQGNSIVNYTETEYKDLTNLYSAKSDKSAVTFLENYIHSDVAAVRFKSFSSKLWRISPPARERFATHLFNKKSNKSKLKSISLSSTYLYIHISCYLFITIGFLYYIIRQETVEIL